MPRLRTQCSTMHTYTLYIYLRVFTSFWMNWPPHMWYNIYVAVELYWLRHPKFRECYAIVKQLQMNTSEQLVMRHVQSKPSRVECFIWSWNVFRESFHLNGEIIFENMFPLHFLCVPILVVNIGIEVCDYSMQDLPPAHLNTHVSSTAALNTSCKVWNLFETCKKFWKKSPNTASAVMMASRKLWMIFEP